MERKTENLSWRAAWALERWSVGAPESQGDDSDGDHGSNLIWLWDHSSTLFQARPGGTDPEESCRHPSLGAFHMHHIMLIEGSEVVLL